MNTRDLEYNESRECSKSVGPPRTHGGIGAIAKGRAPRYRALDEDTTGSRQKHLLSPVPDRLMKNSSLQGIHAQSSTETSGLGETITSGCSSQESVHSGREPHQHDGYRPTPANQGSTANNNSNSARSPPEDKLATDNYSNYSSFASPPVVYVQVEDRTWRPIHMHPDANVHPRGPEGLTRRRRSLERAIELAGMNNRSGAHSDPHTAAATVSTSRERYRGYQTNFDDLFTTGENSDKGAVQDNTSNQGYHTHRTFRKPMTTGAGSYGLATPAGQGYGNQSPGGLQPDQPEESRSRRNSVRSLSSLGGGSFRSRSGSTRSSKKFLGKNTESRWLRWSKDRRLSYRRKLDMMEKENQEEDRIPTPVKKARKECLKFVHPDLEHKYLSEEDLKDHHRQQQVQQQYYYGMLDAKNGEGLHLTIMEWHLLADYWDHQIFNRSRFVGVGLSFLGLLFTIVSLTNGSWMYYDHIPKKGEVIQGLWHWCWVSADGLDVCDSFSTNWQNAVIGFMLFAASFGFLASILSIMGVCTTPLPKKIYYFHSSGEVFLVCAASLTFALLIYPMSIELDETIQNHSYGIGYGLGWGAAFFFYAAALCMSLDELVRATSRAKCCRCCWGKPSEDERGNLRQV